MQLNSDYKLHRNRKIRNYEYDIIAVSKRSNEDIIYEIKAWDNLITRSNFMHTCEKMFKAEQNYKEYMERKCHSVLMVVTKQDVIDYIQKNKMDESIKERYGMQIEFLDMQSLWPENKDTIQVR